MTFEFTTSRLNVVDWCQAQLNLGEAFYGQLLAILTPEVTKACLLYTSDAADE